MAASKATSSSSIKISTTSHDTALCIIPPHPKCGDIDRLRELYDKSYGVWPAHINIVYPFVAPENLERAQEQIQAHFDRNLDPTNTHTITLNETGMFKHRNNSTIFLHENKPQSDSYMTVLRDMVLQALGQNPNATNLHLTIGQTEDNTLFSQQYLLSKARLLPTLRFSVGALAILVRDRMESSGSSHSMRLWGIIKVASPSSCWVPTTPEHWTTRHVNNPSTYTTSEVDLDEATAEEATSFNRQAQSGPTYHYDSQRNTWLATHGAEQSSEVPTNITVSSYNVLIDSEYPPVRDRDPHLVRAILSESAMADILVLQEVSDEFLSYLLDHSEVKMRYAYASHGPPSQPEIGPLSSLRNIVILSCWPFSWHFVPFQRRHKGALIAKFGRLLRDGSSDPQDLVVAGVHLTCGLTDGSVVAKKVQLQNLTNYLIRHHHEVPWIIAGDFNIATSTYTINTALRDRSITPETVQALSSMETALSEVGLVDTWAIAHVEATDVPLLNTQDDLFDGEEGATFDPRTNVLAAATSGTSNNRPQRYDRILVRSQDTIQVSRFNHFGLPEDMSGSQVVPSDHSGVRAALKVASHSHIETLSRTSQVQPTVKLQRATPALSDTGEMSSVLEAHHMFPGEQASLLRRQAFDCLKAIVLGDTSETLSGSADIPLVVVPVGSYALGVWTAESDIDCLCIGTISSKTFFKLVRQRIGKADGQSVRILRKVEANTGTMLELSVDGIAMDLQYCPAARVVERFSEFRNLPGSDPIFNLSILSLRKLKPYRDLLYIERTIPSLSAFRLAYRCLKLWATQRGIYSSKFGFLGGVHLTLMLTWISKSITHDFGSATAADLVTSFFNHFSSFDWTNSMMYDAFFHKTKPRYHRSAREPMVILGYHAPNSNIAHTCTVPALQTLSNEMKLAHYQLSDPSMTWDKFFGTFHSSLLTQGLSPGAADFLGSHGSYIKIDIHFWGRTLAKGKSLVGWVESRCLSLVVDIHKILADLEIRIWPARFTDSDDSANGDYHGCYLIGLSKTSIAANTAEDKQLAKQSLEKVLDRFLSQLKMDEKNYDASTCWLGISLARPSEVKSLHLDNREWGEYAEDLEPDSDDEDELDDADDESSEVKARTIPQRPKPTATPLSSVKLRPASDVLNRLRWDPSLDPADYIIGYEDRFLGAKETSLERWKTEQTDEEFIPQHRVLYFKRRGGDDGKGEIVWERATRIDRVFGSGVGHGGKEIK
ncbi:hypothetical protein FB567DRAFT_26608 [Paraphoma chrysanthemicola]|uniref:polynucleotide adenylyltransferase n=1 Tax=Paraphoma chrysanthemicola TaxID=798071 RepID=A0A8K0W5L0_9PLEO|nr:hypothetical protein FB567DRAFT_26608 [Paraphoma chrysanthemicola]